MQMRLPLYFSMAILISALHFQTSAQKLVIGLQQDISMIQSTHDFDGIVFDEDEYLGSAYNLSLYVQKPIYKNFSVEARLGGFDMEYENSFEYQKNGVEIETVTWYESMQQHYIGLYPGFMWKGNTFSFSMNAGVDFYITRTTVSENSWTPSDPTQIFGPTAHPPLSPSRIGYGGNVKLYFMMDPFAFTMGIGYRRTHLFQESEYFPSHFLNVFDFNLGVAYFIAEKKDESKDPI